MIDFRLLSIASRRYSVAPAERVAASRMMLMNALRIARAHLGDRETARLTLETLTEDRKGKAA